MRNIIYKLKKMRKRTEEVNAAGFIFQPYMNQIKTNYTPDLSDWYKGDK